MCIIISDFNRYDFYQQCGFFFKKNKEFFRNFFKMMIFYIKIIFWLNFILINFINKKNFIQPIYIVIQFLTYNNNFLLYFYRE